MHVRHIDTCLSDYVLDHCNGDSELLIGVPVDRASRVYSVKRALHDEIELRAADYGKPGFDYAAAHAAIDEAFAGTHPLKAWDSSLEPSDEDGETCYSWFRFDWEACFARFAEVDS
jgi:hypothetical protein